MLSNRAWGAILLLFCLILPAETWAQKKKEPKLRYLPKVKRINPPWPPGSILQKKEVQNLVVPIAMEPIRYSACLAARIFFLLDWSASVQGSEGNIANALASLLSNINPYARGTLFFEVIQFGEGHDVLVQLTNDAETLFEALEELKDSGAGFGQTGMATALLEVQESIEVSREEFWDRDFQDIVIVVSDGHINVDGDEEEALRLSEELKMDQVTVFSLNTGKSSCNEAFLINLASENGYYKTSLTSLRKTLENLYPCF